MSSKLKRNKNGTFKVGNVFPQEIKDKISATLKKNPTRYWLGKKRLNIKYALTGLKRSEETKKKISESKKKNPTRYWLGKKRPEYGGKNFWNWKGGITPKNLAVRTSAEYKKWRKCVFERDGYVCVLCKKKGKGDLNADHIKSFSLYPELRFDINNGRTLCVSCHKKTDTYAGRGLKRKKHATTD